MFGAFKPSLINLGGYLWRFTPRLTKTQKSRLRSRMKQVDHNIEEVYKSIILLENKKMNEKTGYKYIDFFKFNFPKENELSPKDKYTTFSKKSKNYRKDVHRVPKWTKKSFRINPKYF